MKITHKTILGFSLIELVVTIVILSIVAAIGSKVLQAGLNAYFQHQYIMDANTQARLAVERITRDIHTINSSNDITTATSSQLVFNDINGNTITYALSGTQLTRNNQVLADGVSSLAFTYFDQNATSTTILSNIRYIVINLSLSQGGVNYTLQTIVNTMNFT